MGGNWVLLCTVLYVYNLVMFFLYLCHKRGAQQRVNTNGENGGGGESKVMLSFPFFWHGTYTYTVIIIQAYSKIELALSLSLSLGRIGNCYTRRKWWRWRASSSGCQMASFDAKLVISSGNKKNHVDQNVMKSDLSSPPSLFAKSKKIYIVWQHWLVTVRALFLLPPSIIGHLAFLPFLLFSAHFPWASGYWLSFSQVSVNLCGPRAAEKG